MRHSDVAVFFLSLALTLFLQWRGNAYRSEWSDNPDEPAHFVTGLMVHDYIAQGLPGPPMAFAQRYYDFYPKVALGHWPPVFYGMQAVWTLIFGVSRISLLLLMAILGALWLTLSYAMVRFSFGVWMAATSVFLLASTLDFQRSTRSLMAEMPVAIFALLALGFLARYLDRGPDDRRDLFWFGIASLLTVLTKGTGIALAPLPILGALAGRRAGILRSPWFWLVPFLAAMLAAVWFLTAPDALHDKVAHFGGFGLIRWSRAGETLHYWTFSLGFIGGALAAIGFLRKAWGLASGRESRGLWTVGVLFFAVTLVCRMVFGPWEARHLLTTLPFLVLFVCDGAEWTLDKTPRYRTVGTAALLVALAVGAVYHMAKIPPKQHLGFDRVADHLMASPQFAHSRFLILSDSLGEGVFIAEVAAREKRPGHTIERGSKVLAEESFMGDRFRLVFDTPEALLRFFEQNPARIVILDGIESGLPILSEMRAMIRRYPERWCLVATYPRAGAEAPLQLFRLIP